MMKGIGRQQQQQLTKSKSTTTTVTITTLYVSCAISVLLTALLLNLMNSSTIGILDQSLLSVSPVNCNHVCSNNNNQQQQKQLSSNFVRSTAGSSAVVGTGSVVAYVPSTLEEYVYKNSKELGMHHTSFLPSGCYLWGDTDSANPRIIQPDYKEKKQLKVVPSNVRQEYLKYKEELSEHYAYITKKFQLQLPYLMYNDNTTSTTERYTDLRHALRYYDHDHVCNAVHVPWGTTQTGTNDSPLLSRIQQQQQQTSTGGTTDINKNHIDQLVEPLLPPLRHLDTCLNKQVHILDLNYMVHDFQYICNSMTSHTRTIFVDMGASLLFHTNDNPAINIAKLYQKFGIIFDHVYAFEMTPFTPAQTKTLFESLVPDLWKTSYHWMNVGVDSKANAPLNPFTMIKQHFLPEDFIVVKLDIDTPFVELPLAHELLNDPLLNTLIDQFYFEYHVKLKELSEWGTEVEGSIYDALHLLTQMREKGIAAHFWV